MADDVRIVAAGREIRATRYEICRNVFTQPCNFGFTIGRAERRIDIINSVPPNSPFQLFVNDVLQFTGLTDGFSGQGEAGQGTELTLRGRDMMSILLGACAKAEETFTDVTYADLVSHALRAVLGPDVPFVLVHTNDANRKAVTSAKAPTSSRTADKRVRGLGEGILVGAVQGAAGGAPTASAAPTAATPPSRTIKVQLGQAWYEGVLKPELDRAGLILFATADGNFFLGAPDTTQRPSFNLVRKYDDEGAVALATNILKDAFSYETTGRHSSYAVSFKAGGGATTRKTGGGEIIDPEMEALGIVRPWVAKDEKVKTVGQADQYVRRRMSDERRAGFRLTYTVRGHSAFGPAGEDTLWAPETTVSVYDDELDIHTAMYCEGVRMFGDAQHGSFTELTVCRLGDILNATPEDGFLEA